MIWAKARVGDVAAIERRTITPERIQDGSNYVGLENVTNEGALVDVAPVSNGELSSSKFAFDEEHVLFGKLRPYLRKTARPSFTGVCSTDILPLRAGKELDRSYLYHALRAPTFVELATLRATGVNLPRLSPKLLAELEIPVPPLPEQRRIAAILDKADALRQKRREAIAKLDQLLQSVFLEMFGDPVTNPKAEIAPLGELCVRVTDGTHQAPQWADSGVPFIFQSHIRAGSISLDTEKFISEKEYERLTHRCRIERGDVLYTIVGSYGNAAVVRTDEKFAFQRHVAHLKPADRLLPDLLEAMLNSVAVKRQVDQRVTGVAQKTLILRELKELKVLVPSLSDQERFEVFAASLRNELHTQRAQAALLESCFASLQQRAFTGQL